VTTLNSMSERKGLPTGRSPNWELSPNAPGVIGSASVAFPGKLPASVVHPSAGTRSVDSSPLYDEVDRRLMDTFPASDAVGRY
jgi:hypothetical protein